MAARRSRWLASGVLVAVAGAAATALGTTRLGARLRSRLAKAEGRAQRQVEDTILQAETGVQQALKSVLGRAEQASQQLVAHTPPARRAQQRHRRHAALVAAGVLAAVVLLPPLAWTAMALLDFRDLARQAGAATRAATGRALTLDGPLRWQLLPPELEARGVALANLPGGSRPQMATAQRIVARVAWLPLLAGRVEITALRVDNPDVLLERTPQGPNWVFAAGPFPAGTAADAASPADTSGPPQPASRLRLRGWRATLGDGVLRIGRGVADRAGADGLVLGVPALELRQDRDFSDMRIVGQVSHAAGVLDLSATLGSAEALRQAPEMPWPLAVALTSADGGRADLRGTVVPGSGRFELALQAEEPDLSALRPLLPAAGLPSLRGVHLSGRAAGDGSRPAVLSDVEARAGASDLAIVLPDPGFPGLALPGLTLADATLSMPTQDGPAQVSADGALGALRLHLAGTIGPVGAAGAGGAAVRLSVLAGDAALSVTGIAAAGAGTDLAMSLRVPDRLAAAMPSAGPAFLPAAMLLRGLTLDARATTPAPGVVALSAIRAASAAGDLSGTLVLDRADRPSLRGSLASTRLDLDALLAVLPGASGHDPARPAPDASVPLPDRALPFARLRDADLDLAARADHVTLAGQDWRRTDAHLVLRAGTLTLDPATVQAPGGQGLAGRLVVDAARSPPAASLSLHATALPLAPLLALSGRGGAASGVLAADAALTAAGSSLRDLAASLDGRLHATLDDASVRTELLQAWADGAPQSVDLGGAAPGRTALRHAALDVSFAQGLGTVRAVSASLPRMALSGAGSVDLRDATLRLRLRVAGDATVLAVSGPLLAPEVEMPGADPGLAPPLGRLDPRRDPGAVFGTAATPRP